MYTNGACERMYIPTSMYNYIIIIMITPATIAVCVGSMASAVYNYYVH